MIKHLRFALLAATLAFLPVPLHSQQPAGSVPPAAGGPRLDVTTAGITRKVSDSAAVSQQRRTRNVGRPVALMIVGGAALFLGLVIGGDVGTLVSLGGAVAFLYGLYHYLR